MNPQIMSLVSTANHIVATAPSLILTLLVFASVGPRPAEAVVLFQETFNTDTANTASTLTTYPAWTFTGGTDAIVNGGQLNLTGNGALFTVPGFIGEHFIDADYGATGVSAGSTQLRFQIGGVRTLFHPDYVPVPGAFRLELNVSLSNQDMGFVPASNVLHHIHIHAHGDGNFDLTITDGNNPLNTYSQSFFDVASIGQPIGFGYNSVGTGFYDNFVVDDGVIIPAPEPSSLLLLGLGALGLVRQARRRNRERVIHSHQC